MLQTALDIKKRAEEKGIEFLLPTQHQVVDSYEPVKGGKIVTKRFRSSLLIGLVGRNIGVETVAHFTVALQDTRLIIWNGPMGVFEEPPFDQGTIGVAKAVAEAADRGATVIVAGGDSVSAVTRASRRSHHPHFNRRRRYTRIPGVVALADKL